MRLFEKAEAAGYDWEVELVYNPDRTVAEHEGITISADGWVIDESEKWFNMTAFLLENQLIIPAPPIIFAE